MLVPHQLEQALERPIAELVDIYSSNLKRKLSDPIVLDGVYVSCFNGLSLKDYICVRRIYCLTYHAACTVCNSMITVAQSVLEDGYCLLSNAFSIVSPGVKYSAEKARRKLLQMPLVSICIGNPAKGKSFMVLLEHIEGVDYSKFSLVINGLADSFSTRPDIPQKECVKMLLSMAQSDRERKCLKFAILKSSGLSFTQARHRYGFENMPKLTAQVQDAMAKVKRIREAVEDIAQVQDKALLVSFGIAVEDTSDSEPDSDVNMEPCKLPDNIEELIDHSKKVLLSSGFNWFNLQEELERIAESDSDLVLNEVFNKLPSFGFSADQIRLVVQSKEAYLASLIDTLPYEKTAKAVNGLVVSESEADDPVAYCEIRDLASDKAKNLIAAKRKGIQARMRRLRAKAIAEQCFLSRKSSKRVSKIVSECQDIGSVIETFVSEHNVGADAWRRTGVLTFDGNTKLGKKVTYERIRLHLQEVYKRKFSYGTVVQLCVARNKRRLSSKRYLGVAKVTTRRA